MTTSAPGPSLPSSAPDGVEVVADRIAATHLVSPPLLVVEPVVAVLDELGIGAGPLAWQRIGDGQSNVTYLLERGGARVVLRRGPRPPLPRSTHDMVREARVQAVLGAEGVPVPRILGVVEDLDVLGVPFYLMEHLDGEIITDRIPAALSAEADRRATGEAVVDALVRLHRLDVTQGELATLGRPDGYLERQVGRFASLWEGTTRRDIPDVARLADWLAAHRPDSARAAVVHGDYRMGNLMFARDAPPRVAAILDWEMATLGDPLADLGYLTATWAQAGSEPTTMELTPVTAEGGYPDRAGIVARYQEATGADVSGIAWYQALALWKAAIFSEAIYVRWLDGERPGDAFAPGLERGVPRLLEAARGFAGLGPA
jgi:aminoglycoside phosphotransferase (APT) family kinase protein